MPVNNAANCSMTLEGEWSIDRADDLLKLLAAKLALLLETDPAPKTAEIDMKAVAELDACGCQLLALFLENLRRRGITPVPCGVPAPAMDKIELLGFSGAFAAPEQPTGNLHD